MAHQPTKSTIDRSTLDRLSQLKAHEENGLLLLKDFAVFIDTHRDQPHVGVFYEDIHRGQCRPTMVSYVIGDDYLLNQESGEILQRHEKHLFVTNEFYSQFLVDYLMTNGSDPRDGNGCLPTSHFRDSRAKRYELKSFREIVRLRHLIKENRLTRRRKMP